MMIMGAWAGDQLPAVSGTEVTIGQSWTMGVVLLVTVGVGLLSCACAAVDPQLPAGNVHVTEENQRLHGSQEACL